MKELHQFWFGNARQLDYVREEREKTAFLSLNSLNFTASVFVHLPPPLVLCRQTRNPPPRPPCSRMWKVHNIPKMAQIHVKADYKCFFSFLFQCAFPTQFLYRVRTVAERCVFLAQRSFCSHFVIWVALIFFFLARLWKKTVWEHYYFSLFSLFACLSVCRSVCLYGKKSAEDNIRICYTT